MKHVYLCLLLFFFVCACSDEKENLIDPYIRIELDDEIYNASVEGGTKAFKIYTNLSDWELVPAVVGGYDWCQTSIGLSASNIHLLMLTVTPNIGIDTREAEFVLRGSGVAGTSFKVAQLGSKPAILVKPVKRLSKDAQTFSLEVTANVEYTLRNEKSWLKPLTESTTRSMVTSEYQYSVTENTELTSRKDVIYIESDRIDELIEVPIEQLGMEMVEVPEIGEKIENAVKSVELVQGNTYSDKLIGNTIDGRLDTWYATNKKIGENVIIDYTLNEVEQIDYIILQPNPRVNNTNQLTKGKIFYKTANVLAWMECGEFDETSMGPIRVDVDLLAPTSIRLELERTLTAGNLSFAEFECYRNKSEYNLKADAIYFDDDVFSRLKPGTTPADIEKITFPLIRSIARALYEGNYSTEFRARTYKSCMDPHKVGSNLSFGSRSICDNPTGLFFEKGKNYIMFVGDNTGKNVLNLHIRDWRENGANQTVGLKRGMNTLTPEVNGTGYIQYWTDTDDTSLDVKVHVCNGEEIGFWDTRAGHTNEDWPRILKLAEDCAVRLNLENAMLDVLGERIQLINKVTAFRNYSPIDIQAVVDMHDELLDIEYSMIGLVKNNAVPKNRMLGVRSWGGSPNWNGTSANFPNEEESMLVKQKFIQDIWLYGHEFGHGNQVAQMKRGGWSEVTNNLYAQQAMYLMGNGRSRLEHDDNYRRPNYTDKHNGDRFNAYFYDAIVQNMPYLTQVGELKSDERGEYNTSDPFVSLVPLWQLSLFFTLSEGALWFKPDFWADIHWEAIQDDNSSYSYGERYVKFMKRAMDASGYDLTDFFEQMDLLQEFDIKVGDYGGLKNVAITKEMVNDVKSYALNKLKAPTSVICYISANSLDTYRNQLPVQGSFGQGISDGDKSKIVNHSVWKNVVAFETYSGDKLVDICISGTGSGNNSTTFVRYPEGSTRIEAVSWNGEKTLVCGMR